MGAGASLGLFHAADTGDIHEVSKAVNSGVDVNEKERSSRQTPLMAACRGGHKEVVLILLRAGADPNSVDSLNQTALHFTAAAPSDKCHNLPEIVEALVEHRADVGVKDTEGNTPLHLYATKGDAACLIQLVKSGAPIDAMDKWRRTPLLVAASRSHVEAARALLHLGASPNSQCGAWSFNGFKYRPRWTPLHCAAARGHLAMARLLIDYGADATIVDAKGDTPLAACSPEIKAELTLLVDDWRRKRQQVPVLPGLVASGSSKREKKKSGSSSDGKKRGLGGAEGGVVDDPAALSVATDAAR